MCRYPGGSPCDYFPLPVFTRAAIFAVTSLATCAALSSLCARDGCVDLFSSPSWCAARGDRRWPRFFTACPTAAAECTLRTALPPVRQQRHERDPVLTIAAGLSPARWFLRSPLLDMAAPAAIALLALDARDAAGAIGADDARMPSPTNPLLSDHRHRSASPDEILLVCPSSHTTGGAMRFLAVSSALLTLLRRGGALPAILSIVSRGRGGLNAAPPGLPVRGALIHSIHD